VVNILN